MEPGEMMMEMEEPRFTTLRIISVIFKVIAVIVAVVGIISAFGTLFTALAIFAKLAAFVGVLVTVAVQAILLWAGGELINLLIALEHNTFMTKEALQKSTMRAA